MVLYPCNLIDYASIVLASQIVIDQIQIYIHFQFEKRNQQNSISMCQKQTFFKFKKQNIVFCFSSLLTYFNTLWQSRLIILLQFIFQDVKLKALHCTESIHVNLKAFVVALHSSVIQFTKHFFKSYSKLLDTPYTLKKRNQKHLAHDSSFIASHRYSSINQSKQRSPLSTTLKTQSDPLVCTFAPKASWALALWLYYILQPLNQKLKCF